MVKVEHIGEDGRLLAVVDTTESYRTELVGRELIEFGVRSIIFDQMIDIRDGETLRIIGPTIEVS